MPFVLKEGKVGSSFSVKAAGSDPGVLRTSGGDAVSQKIAQTL